MQTHQRVFTVIQLTNRGATISVRVRSDLETRDRAVAMSTHAASACLSLFVMHINRKRQKVIRLLAPMQTQIQFTTPAVYSPLPCTCTTTCSIVPLVLASSHSSRYMTSSTRPLPAADCQRRRPLLAPWTTSSASTCSRQYDFGQNRSPSGILVHRLFSPFSNPTLLSGSQDTSSGSSGR